MNVVQQLLSHGTVSAWLFIPTAILLGALHGLEPGHSKTMMAAFIIAIRGTVTQAIFLGLAAAFSHTLIIWLLAGIALHYGSHWNVETPEPYFQIVSGVMICVLAAWMLGRTKRDVDLESAHDHAHDHAPPQKEGRGEFQDAHEAAHADEIAQRFAGRSVTTGQVILFGLTGGLMPCPAALSILLVCLQIKHFSLGLSLVLAFSLGLAVTLVSVGVLAAWSLRHAQRTFTGLGSLARKLPYLSGALLFLLGLFLGLQGLSHLIPFR